MPEVGHGPSPLKGGGLLGSPPPLGERGIPRRSENAKGRKTKTLDETGRRDFAKALSLWGQDRDRKTPWPNETSDCAESQAAEPGREHLDAERRSRHRDVLSGLWGCVLPAIYALPHSGRHPMSSGEDWRQAGFDEAEEAPAKGGLDCCDGLCFAKTLEVEIMGKNREDDKEDLLRLPEGGPGRPKQLETPQARAKRAKGLSKALRLPETVDPPKWVEDPEDKDSWWPYYDPDRDGYHYGKPRKIKSPEEFDALVDDYFRHCKKLNLRPTMTGLVLHLGFASQQSLTDYTKRYGGMYADSIKRARNMVKLAYEHHLIREQGSVQGVIFALRSFGRHDEDGPDFEDVQRTELTGKDGKPVAIAQLSATLENMNDVEKATRLYHILKAAMEKGNDEGEDDEHEA